MYIKDDPSFLNIFQDVALNDYLTLKQKEDIIKEELRDYRDSGYSKESIKWILKESFNIPSKELKENKTPDAKYLNMCWKNINEIYA